MFGQTFAPYDLWIIAVLVLLEGILSIDNALVLGLLAKRLPKSQQKRALTYGLVGAFVFRLLAIATATFLLKWTVVKLLGGGYLLYVGLSHLLKSHADHGVKLDASGHPILDDDHASPVLDYASPERPDRPGIKYAGFWSTVVVIEMTDIAFAVDSILAAIAVVGPAPRDVAPHPKLWVILAGGFLGVILMRFAAVLFIKLLERFPRFETSAYLLVCVIGLKLLIDYVGNGFFEGHPVNFHSPHNVWFWAFWVAMLAAIAIGFLPGKKPDPVVQAAAHDDSVTPV